LKTSPSRGGRKALEAEIKKEGRQKVGKYVEEKLKAPFGGKAAGRTVEITS